MMSEEPITDQLAAAIRERDEAREEMQSAIDREAGNFIEVKHLRTQLAAALTDVAALRLAGRELCAAVFEFDPDGDVPSRRAGDLDDLLCAPNPGRPLVDALKLAREALIRTENGQTGGPWVSEALAALEALGVG